MKKQVIIAAAVLAPVLLTGADKCSLDAGGAGGSSGGRLAVSPCDAAVATQDANYRVWEVHKTKQNYRIFIRSQNKAIQVCTAEGKKIRHRK